MKVKKVRYNSRSGYSVEWYDPHSFMISSHHANVILALLSAVISDEKMNEAFNLDERHIINRYEELRVGIICQEGKKVDEIKNLSVLRRILMERLTLFYESAIQEPITFRKEYLGWAEPSNTELVNNQYRLALKEPDTPSIYFEALIILMGMPSQDLMHELESRFGSFNPATGKFARPI